MHCACLCLNAARAATIPVYNTNDAFAGSLRQAINDANPAGGDTIVFQIPTSSAGYNPSSGVFTIGLTSGELFVNKSLIIDGEGKKIVIQRASGSFRIFQVAAGTVTLANLAIANGVASSAGGIYNSGNLTLRNCSLYSNTTGTDGPYGGAIFSGAGGSLRITRCTFTANRANNDGSAIYIGYSDVTIENSTIFSNGSASAVFHSGNGTVRVRNSIIAGGGITVSGAFVSEGYNIIGSAAGSTGFGNIGDQIGVSAAQVNLGPLQDNGGSTSTMRPLPGSLAIDQGKRGLDANGVAHQPRSARPAEPGRSPRGEQCRRRRWQRHRRGRSRPAPDRPRLHRHEYRRT